MAFCFDGVAAVVEVASAAVLGAPLVSTSDIALFLPIYFSRILGIRLLAVLLYFTANFSFPAPFRAFHFVACAPSAAIFRRFAATIQNRNSKTKNAASRLDRPGRLSLTCFLCC